MSRGVENACNQKALKGISGLDVINMDMDVGERPGLGFALGLGWIICKPSSSNKREAGFTGYGVLYQLRAVRAMISGEAAVPSTSNGDDSGRIWIMSAINIVWYYCSTARWSSSEKRRKKERPKHSGREGKTKSCCCCGSRSGSKMRAEPRAELDEASFAAFLLACFARLLEKKRQKPGSPRKAPAES